MSLDPKRAAVSNWQKEQSRRGERSVEAIKDRRDQGRGSDGMMMLRITLLSKGKRREGYFLLRGGKDST